MTRDPAPKCRAAAFAAVSVVLATSAVLSGCSSSASSSSASTKTPSTPAAAASSATASSTSATSASPTSHSAIATGGSFCKRAALAQAQQAKQVSALAAGSPAALEKLEKQALAELPTYLAIAPSAIKGDLTVIVAADKKLYNALAAAHFDVRKLNPTSFTALDTPTFKNAAAAIATYLDKQCGIKTTPTS